MVVEFPNSEFAAITGRFSRFAKMARIRMDTIMRGETSAFMAEFLSRNIVQTFSDIDYSNIILKFPVALAKNKDLLRFGLDNKHYFNTLNDLIDLIHQNKSENFTELIVREEYRRDLLKERSLDLIVEQWLSILNK